MVRRPSSLLCMYLYLICTYSSSAAVVLTEVVPTCDYYPSYAYIHKVKRYDGWRPIADASVYPDDHTELDVVRRDKWRAEGNPIIDQSVRWFMSVLSL